jgi:hypothetical protein
MSIDNLPILRIHKIDKHVILIKIKITLLIVKLLHFVPIAIWSTNLLLNARRRQPTTRMPSVAHGTIFNATLSELKNSNYDLIKIEFLVQWKNLTSLK